VREEAGETPELIVADVDADEVAEVRRAVAVLDNRRL
jgi:deaminated glutathione amidase